MLSVVHRRNQIDHDVDDEIERYELLCSNHLLRNLARHQVACPGQTKCLLLTLLLRNVFNVFCCCSS